MRRLLRPDLGCFSGYYAALLQALLHAPTEVNERTGTRIAVLSGGVSFGLDLSDNILPSCGLRKTYPKVAAAEVAWYLSGEQDATWMTSHAPIWDKFIEPLEELRITSEGRPYTTNFQGVAAAYGYRWRQHFGRDQIALAIDALQRNPTDRRVLVSAWDPEEDGLGALDQKNVPCPAMFTLSVTEGMLHSTMLLRSSDVFVGLPYDVLGHALLMDAIATTLGVRLGVAQFSLAHVHLYEAHWEMARIALTQPRVVPSMPMPCWKIHMIEKDRDSYVALVRDLAKHHTWPVYAPRPEVIA